MTIDWKKDSEYISLKKRWDMEEVRRRIWVKKLTNRPIKWRLRTYIRIKPVIRWKRYV
jgi:hypothetical protein